MRFTSSRWYPAFLPRARSRAGASGLVGFILLSVLLYQFGGRAQQRGATPAGGDWPMYRHDLAGTGYSPLDANQYQERRELTPGLDLSSAERRARAAAAARTRRPGRRAIPRRRRSSSTASCICPPRTASSRSSRRRARRSGSIRSPAARRRGAASRTGRATGSHPPRIIFTAGRRLIALNATTGALDRRLRQGRRSRLVVPYNSVPLVYQERRRRRREHAAGRSAATGQSARLRCAHGREAVGIQLRAAAGRRRPRHVGRRQLEGPPRRQRVAVLLHARRAARTALSAARVADWRRLRRRSEGRQPVRQLGGRGRRRRPARTSGTSRRSITISGTPIRRRLPGLFDIVRNGRTIPALALTTKSGYLYISESRNRPADLRRRRAPGRQERRARRAGVCHAAVSGEAAAARARQLQAGGSRHRRRHDGRTRQGLPGHWSTRSAASTTPARSRRGCTARKARRRRARWCFPEGSAARTGAAPRSIRRSGYVFVVTQDDRRARLDGEDAEGSPSPYDKTIGPSAPASSMCRMPAAQLAVPETAMGPPDGRQRLDRRHRVADPARHHRTAARGQAEHRTAGAGRPHRDRRRPAVRRVHRRQPLPRARCEDRQGAVGDQARAEATPTR